MYILRLSSEIACILLALLWICGGIAHAQKEYSVPVEAKYVLQTCLPVYIYEDDECKFILTKELSRNAPEESLANIRFKYVITARYVTSDYTIWTCSDLPEIGEWTVISHKRGNIKKDISPTFTLQCNKYSTNATLTHSYNLWYGTEEIVDTSCGNYPITKWGFQHWGNRPSLENLYSIRFSKKNLYEFQGEKSSFQILLVKDVQDIKTRYNNHYDDVFVTMARHSRSSYYDTIQSYVIPRIYFVDLEQDSLVFDRQDAVSEEISFTLIVQHSLSDDGVSWEYHRLKVSKEWGLADFITITDLGPVPRSEWEPGWPDPATTPLWVEEVGD